MEKFFIIKIRTIVVLWSLVFLLQACKNQSENRRNYIPDEVIKKGLEFVLNDKKYERLLSQDIGIQKNLLVADIAPFKVGRYKVSMIDSADKKDASRKNIAFFEFYNSNIFSAGKIDITYYMSRTGMNVQLVFEKKNDAWVIIESNPHFL